MSTPSPLATAIAEALQRELKLHHKHSITFSTETLADVIDRAIAEHQKAIEMLVPTSVASAAVTPSDGTPWVSIPTVAAPICQRCGKREREHFGSSFFCRIDSTENLDHFTSVEPKAVKVEMGQIFKAEDEYSNDHAKTWKSVEPQYRLLKAGEEWQEGDETSNDSGDWFKTYQIPGSVVGLDGVGRFRRPRTPNQPQPGTPPQ